MVIEADSQEDLVLARGEEEIIGSGRVTDVPVKEIGNFLSRM